MNLTIVFGPDPIINNKYWAKCVKLLGHKALTIMNTYYSINDVSDYDYVLSVSTKTWFPPFRILFRGLYMEYLLISKANVLICPMTGWLHGKVSLILYLEYILLRTAGIKIITIPYGSDTWIYNELSDLCLQHALLMSYPLASRNADTVSQRIRFWEKCSDFICSGLIADCFSRWDILPVSVLHIDTDQWKSRPFSNDKQKNEKMPIRIVHTPNHRGFKGTEFIINIIQKLQREGHNIELILLEKRSNEEVRELFQTADILVEQIVFTGYSLSGIEGMATGIPVIANLESDQNLLRLMRRYSYLDECPILSASPETLYEVLKQLISSQELQLGLGKACRQYVEKYHSLEAGSVFWNAVLKKVVNGEEPESLINFFHPLIGHYKDTPKIKHPLVNNKIPDDYWRNTPNEK